MDAISFEERLQYLKNYPGLYPEMKTFFRFIEADKDPTLLMYLEDRDNVNSLVIIFMNKAAQNYYVKHDFDFSLGEKVAKNHGGAIDDFYSFNQIAESINQQEVKNKITHTSKITNNTVSIQSTPITKKIACVVFENITPVINLKDELLDVSKKFELLFKNSPLAILGQQEDRIKYANPKSLELFGYSREEIIGMDAYNLISLDERKKMQQRGLNRRVGKDEPLSYRSRGITKDNVEFPIHMNITSIGNGTDMMIFAIIQDLSRIDELQNILKFRQRMDVLNVLTGGIVHDFNNILTVIASTVELIEKRIDNKDDKDLINKLNVAVDRAIGVIDKIGYLNQKSTGSKEIFDFYDIVSEIFVLLELPKNLNINTEIGFNKGEFTYYGDPVDFHQVLMNLSLNSIEAMSPTDSCNQIKIYIAEEDGSIFITHQDTGSGINSDQATSIFKPFTSTKGTTNKGLGLSMVNHIITNQYNGKITLDTSYSKGTRFIVALPKQSDRISN